MAIDVFKEFLVKIGYKVDDASHKKFKNGLDDMTKSVEKLGEIVAGTEVGLLALVADASEAMEKFYYASQRTGSAVTNIKAFDYAISQAGGSVEGALSSMENLGHFIRSYPGSGEFLKKLGVAPEHVKDAEKSLEDLTKFARETPFWQAQPYANVLGIDEKTWLALGSGRLKESIDDYRSRVSGAGVDMEKSAESGKEFMLALRGIGAEIEVIDALAVEKLAPWTTRRLQEMDQLLRDTVNDPKSVANTFGDAAEGAAESVLGKPGGRVRFTQRDRNEADVYNRLKFLGWSDAAAKGITSRLGEESGFDPHAVGDKGQAYGLFQAHKEWRKLFKQQNGHDIYDSNVVEQVDFVDWALKHSKDKDALATGKALSGVTNEVDAYRLYTNGFEKPANKIPTDGSATVSPQHVTITNNITTSSDRPSEIGQAAGAASKQGVQDAQRNLQGALR